MIFAPSILLGTIPKFYYTSLYFLLYLAFITVYKIYTFCSILVITMHISSNLYVCVAKERRV